MVMCFLPFAFSYLLVGADLVERTSVMNQAPAGSCDPTRLGRTPLAGRRNRTHLTWDEPPSTQPESPRKPERNR